MKEVEDQEVMLMIKNLEGVGVRPKALCFLVKVRQPET